MTTAATPTSSAKRGFLASLMWWKQIDTEIDNQTRLYSTLSITKSARGVSFLCCSLTATLTVLLGRFLGYATEAALLEAAIWFTIGFLMYKGQRWAFILAMILWTVEKGSAALAFKSPGTPIVHIFWWAAYMNAFFLGFKVENRRRELA